MSAPVHDCGEGPGGEVDLPRRVAAGGYFAAELKGQKNEALEPTRWKPSIQTRLVCGFVVIWICLVLIFIPFLCINFIFDLQVTSRALVRGLAATPGKARLLVMMIVAMLMMVELMVARVMMVVHPAPPPPCPPPPCPPSPCPPAPTPPAGPWRCPWCRSRRPTWAPARARRSKARWLPICHLISFPSSHLTP